jgi:tetratricopeptide (TPR) repeat protein
MLDQYNLALEDIAAARYDLARQRLEFIYYQDPKFLDVVDQLVNVMFILSTTSQPTSAVLLEPTATPTQDPRPKEELFIAAQALQAAHDWTKTIDTLLALRKADPNYRTADVDGMLYTALRNRGVQNIVELGLFEPGLYDFSLAEAFGPLDAQAVTYREFARMYLFGNAFWYAYPDQAVYYYGQAMAIAPDLRDASGLSAFARYWQSLVDWGDALAKAGDWCGAAEKYQLALNARQDNELQPTASFANTECLGPTDIPTLTVTPFLSSTPTFTGSPGPTSTPSATYTPGATDTPSETPTPSDTPVPSDTPMPSDTPTETPVDTPTT